MSVYRKIKKNQFAFSPVTSRNGEKITVALKLERATARTFQVSVVGT
jgi:hypothetical protein